MNRSADSEQKICCSTICNRFLFGANNVVGQGNFVERSRSRHFSMKRFDEVLQIEQGGRRKTHYVAISSFVCNMDLQVPLLPCSLTSYLQKMRRQLIIGTHMDAVTYMIGSERGDDLAR